MQKARGLTFEGYASCGMQFPDAGWPRSAWMCFPWACRTILKLRLKRDRVASGWGRRFSGKEPRLEAQSTRGNTNTPYRIASDEALRPAMISVHESTSDAWFAVKVHPRAKKN